MRWWYGVLGYPESVVKLVSTVAQVHHRKGNEVFHHCRNFTCIWQYYISHVEINTLPARSGKFNCPNRSIGKSTLVVLACLWPAEVQMLEEPRFHSNPTNHKIILEVHWAQNLHTKPNQFISITLNKNHTDRLSVAATLFLPIQAQRKKVDSKFEEVVCSM